ncbi:MAG: gliding motility-associated C-terminal domain-containing protein [Flavobacteriia bacterium]|nr:gliding motility-associated C-terminal domain-containing protein [Flavobacteriia bacterium]
MKKQLRNLFRFAEFFQSKTDTKPLPIVLKTLFSILFLANLTFVNAQGPGSLFVDAGPDQTIGCATGDSADITANFLEIFETVSEQYTVTSIPYNPPFAFNGLANPLNPNIDDAWSPVDNLPFDFCFFGNLEQQFQVGSNGVLRFDVDPSDTTNGWSFTENLPNNSNPTLGEANIFTPVHDIDPSVSTTEEIGYEVLGTFPNRVLVVSYYQVPMFSGTCNSLLATHMAVFYEFSNVIEIYMQDKPVCPSWNSGNAALGIQNNDGTIAYVPPGRNTSDSPWTATNEAWQFAPQGLPTYVFEWVDEGGNVISNNPTITVSPTVSETFTARVTYTNGCNGQVVVLEDSVTVFVQSTVSVELGADQSFCDVASYEIVPTITGADPGAVTYLWSTGETTPTITITQTGIYSVEVTFEGCTVSDAVFIELNENPIFDLGQDLATCFEAPVTLDASPSNYNPADATYQWLFNGVDTGITEATFNVTAYGTYTAIVTVGLCSAQQDINITPGAAIEINLGDDFVTCFENQVILDATPTNYNPQLATFEWFLDGVVLANTQATLEVTVNGTYSVIVTIGQCSATDSIVISPSADLVVTLGENISGCTAETRTLSAVTFEDGVTYVWFKNGNLIAGENTNTITISLADVASNLSDVYRVEITKGECSGFDEVEALTLNCVISEGLSPDGSPGFNDNLDLTFLANRTGIDKLQIFNRLGAIVYESNNYTNQWVGQSDNGDKLPTGTYFYVINFSGNDSVYGKQKTGWIYINREAN